MSNDLIKAYAQEVVASPLCSLYMSKTWLIKPHHLAIKKPAPLRGWFSREERVFSGYNY